MGEPRGTTSVRRRRVLRLAPAGLALIALAVPGHSAVAASGPDAPKSAPAMVMMPTGGGYEPETLEAFGAAAAKRSPDATVVIAVVPSAYGDDLPSRPENIALAKERTAEIAAACQAVVPAGKRCVGKLSILLNRADAMNPKQSVALRDASLDGVYILGGDQGIAMQVLANSPAERAMTAAYRSGVVISGTSAGAAVESRTMINGYTGPNGAAQGLQKDATLIWWGNDGDAERGLTFGSQKTIYDQHFYQRGRFGRTLATIAQADERFGGKSPLGVGTDYATGVVNTGDRTLSGMFGQGSVALIDYETFAATHRWIGDQGYLSARRILTSLMTDRVRYDLNERTLTLGGAMPTISVPQPYTFPSSSNAGTLFLGGGSGYGPDVVTPAFVKQTIGVTTDPANARMVILSGDYASTAAEVGDKVKSVGWSGRIDTYTYGRPGWSTADVANADAVVLVANSPKRLATAMADPRFRAMAAAATKHAPVVLTQGAMTATLGSRWSPVPRPTSDNYEDVAVQTFKVGEAKWRPGLGIIPATLVPTLNNDYLWGRLYAGVRADSRELAFGLTAGSAIRVPSGGDARVIGGSVVSLDSRGGQSWSGANKSMGATGAIMDVFAPGEVVGRR